MNKIEILRNCPKKLDVAIIISKYKNQWLMCRKKFRDTWEFSGGHIETGETATQAAIRELYEEIGATVKTIRHICYFVHTTDKFTKYGEAFFAEIDLIDSLPPNSEMEEVKIFDKLPTNLSYEETYRKILSFFNKQ
ncbi:MAG: NUDIX domain-containing protein [Christensenellaceae bacterium]|jgi:8-oxo-dGTP diphosphatase|nr:NUDIX domain-containing protein [Christensenellaceae bacterium]